jgi:hypothetical protein
MVTKKEAYAGQWWRWRAWARDADGPHVGQLLMLI